MVTAICERVVCTQDTPIIKVLSGQSISLESKGTDSSLRLTFNVSNNNYPIMLYFLRFFKRGTSHKIIGSLNVSAYSFEDSTRAFASTRIGITSVSPIREIDHYGNIIGHVLDSDCVPVDDKMYPIVNEDYLKAKFIIFKYVWENWGIDRLVTGCTDNIKESFSDTLEDVYEDLVEARILPSNFNPVAIEEREVKRLRKNRGSSRSAKKVAVRVPNSSVLKTDLSSPFLNLVQTLDDSIPFDVSLFLVVVPPPPNSNSPNPPDNANHNGTAMEQ